MNGDLGDMDFSDIFQDIASRSGTPTVKLDAAVKSELTKEVVNDFLVENNLPSDTAIGALGEDAVRAFMVKLATTVKVRGYSDDIAASLVGEFVKGFRKDAHWPRLLNQVKSEYALECLKNHGIDLTGVKKNKGVAIQTALSGEAIYTRNVKGGRTTTTNFAQVANFGGLAAINGELAQIVQQYGRPVPNDESLASNWPDKIIDRVSELAEKKRAAVAAFKQAGLDAAEEYSRIFKTRKSRDNGDFSLQEDMFLAIAFESISDKEQANNSEFIA